MKGGRRTLIALIILFVVLAGAVVWQQLAQQQAQQRRLADLPGELVFPGMSRTLIQAVRIESPGGGASFTIARGEDETWIAPGYDGELTQNQAEAIAATVELLPYYNRIDAAAEEPLSTYGLSPLGTLLVQVVMKDGTQHAIAIGNLTASGDTYYAAIDNRPEIYVIERRAVAFLIVALRDATS